MALDSAFEKRFEEEASNARKTGTRSAWAMAMGGAIAGGLPLFAQGEYDARSRYRFSNSF